MIQTDPAMARKARWASLVGTSLESYDFYIYAYFAAFFVGPLFFDPLGGFGGTLAAFLSIALAFIIRPVGAIVFGHIGDRIGRRKTLIVTVTLMGVATGLIGVLPTYDQAGWFGAAILVILRLLQGISLGGEWGGAVLVATEHESGAKRAFAAADGAAGLPDRLDPLRHSLHLVDPCSDDRRNRRVGVENPFWTAIPLLLVSLYLRLAITETPVFEDVVKRERRPKVPFFTLLAQTALRDFHRRGCCAAGNWFLLPDEHLHHQLRSSSVGLRLLRVAHRDHHRWAPTVDHHSPLRGLGDAHRILQRCRLGSIRNTPRGVPDLLLPAICELWCPGCHDAHRWNPPHHELGRPRWGLQRPL